jgi:hypothetical protein
MNILEFTCLRAGFTPKELGLDDSVLEGAGNQPLSIRYDLGHDERLYRVFFKYRRPAIPKPRPPYIVPPPRDWWTAESEREAVASAEAARTKGATA